MSRRTRRNPLLGSRSGARTSLVVFTDARWARVVWSLLGGDRCFIQHGDEITFGEHLNGAPETAFATWFPVRYVHRFLWDWRRRSIFSAVNALIMLLVFLLPIRTFSDTWNVAITLMVGLLVFLALVQYLFQEYDTGGVWLRLGVGLVAGVLWAGAGGTLSPMTAAGAVWIFTFANLIAIATLGYDRSLFRSELRAVGGPLSETEALRTLDAAADGSEPL